MAGIIITGGLSITGPGFSFLQQQNFDGLSSGTASSSAYAIKQAYPNSTDGLYWIQNESINSGNPFQIYADMTTDGGGWTLIMQNNYHDWDFNNALLRNQTTPPSTLVSEGTFGSDGATNYSIIGWADNIKRSASGFDYMLEAYARGRNGGIWTANQAYSFVGQIDTAAYNSLGSTVYFGGSEDLNDVINGTAGFRQNITDKVIFPAGTSAENGTWEYANDGIERRMPWYANNPDDPGNTFVGEAIFTTSHDDGGSWWGSPMSSGNFFSPAPWINGGASGSSVDGFNPLVIWYWVR